MSRRDRRRQASRTASPGPRPAGAPPSADARRAFMGAVQHFQAGHDSQAETLCRQVLRAMPNNPDALLLLGMIMGRSGRYDEAVSVLDHCIEQAPGNPAAHLNLGRALAALGRTDDALAAYNRSLHIEPRLAEAHYSLGNLKREAEELDDAASAYRRAVELQPSFAPAWDNLGNVLQELERYDEALEAYQQVLSLDPASASVHNNLGTLFWQLKRRQEAISAYEAALQINPRFADAWVNLGKALKDVNQPEQSEDAFKRALDIDSDNADTLGYLSALYEQINQLDDAMATAERGLAIDPDHPRCNLVAAMCERRTGRVEVGIHRLERLVDDLKPQSAVRTLYQLGSLHDRAGNTADAFETFRKANRLAQDLGDGYTTEKARYLEKLDNMKARFTPDWIERWSRLALSDERPTPAFLVGFPRSGTTLLEQIIDSHPRLKAIDERPTMDEVTRLLESEFGEYPEALAALGASDIMALRDAYFRVADAYVDRDPTDIVVDKMPLNLTDAGLIYRLFPDARFIFALRHPCDACLSCFMQDFTANDAMVNFFTIKDTANLYDKVMKLWRQYRDVLPLNWHRIRYEDLVADFRGEVEALLDFLGVGWDDAVLEHTDHARTRGRIFTPSYHQVSEPIYTRSRYRWRNYSDDLAPVMNQLQPWIDYYGYDAD